MGLERLQTKIPREIYEYLLKRTNNTNVYKLTQEAVIGYYELLRTMDAVNFQLGTDFDDPSEFLAVVKTLLRHKHLSRLLIEALQEGV